MLERWRPILPNQHIRIDKWQREIRGVPLEKAIWCFVWKLYRLEEENHFLGRWLTYA